jgi:hypothetical protein
MRGSCARTFCGWLLLVTACTVADEPATVGDDAFEAAREGTIVVDGMEAGGVVGAYADREVTIDRDFIASFDELGAEVSPVFAIRVGDETYPLEAPAFSVVIPPALAIGAELALVVDLGPDALAELPLVVGSPQPADHEYACGWFTYVSGPWKGSCGGCGVGKARYNFNVYSCPTCGGSCYSTASATWCDYC